MILPLAGAAYLGVGFTLGSWCRSAASLSAGLMLYLLLSSSLAAATFLFDGAFARLTTSFSLEAALFGVFFPREAAAAASPLALVPCAFIWPLLGHWSFRRLEER